MKVKPILFSGPMVRAILAGAKTQTRRVIKPQPQDCKTRLPMVEQVADYCTGNPEQGKAYYCRIAGCWNSTEPFFPAHKPGDVLWVRETWREFDSIDECGCSDAPCGCPPHGCPIYRADQDDGESIWRPSIFMPKKHCRIFLKITNVRAEWLRDISMKDCLAEGVGELPDHGKHFQNGSHLEGTFRALWDCLNAKRGYGWDESPWVWVYEFERTAKPEGWPDA